MLTFCLRILWCRTHSDSSAISFPSLSNSMDEEQEIEILHAYVHTHTHTHAYTNPYLFKYHYNTI